MEKENITISDIMTKAVVSADEALSIHQAAKIMEDTKVGCLVVTKNNTPVGIVTDRDFAVRVVAHAYNTSDKIHKIMSTPLFSINPSDSVRAAADLMYTRDVRKLPVIENDNVVGIITATDIVNELANCTEEDMKKIYFNTVSTIYQNYNPYR